MSALEFKLEYFQGAGGYTDEGVYIQLRTEVPAYQAVITKEVYYSPSNTVHSAFINDVFSTNGVVRCAAQAWRLYIEKSPVFQWSEILGIPTAPGVSPSTNDSGDFVPANPSVLYTLMTYQGNDTIQQLSGSGLTLIDPTERRAF